METQGKSISIGGNLFEVQPLLAMESWKLQPLIAPVVAEVFAGLADVGELSEANVAVFVPVVGKVFANHLKPNDLEHITRTLLQGATMDNKQLFTSAGDPFNILMRGRMLDTWKLLWFAIQTSYPDFFNLLSVNAVAAQAAAKAMEESASQGLSTSPPVGPAGAS